MKENILDVLLYLFENYIESDQSLIEDPDTIRDELIEAGFQQREVTKAFEWLESLAQQQAIKTSIPAFRIFCDQEIQKLDVECRGFLLYLESCGILTPTNRELVIDRAMALEADEITLEQLKWVILMVLFSLPDEETAYARMETLVLDTLPPRLH